MGLSVFDLLDEVFDENQVRDFLTENDVECLSYGPRALVARFIVYLMRALGNDEIFVLKQL